MAITQPNTDSWKKTAQDYANAQQVYKGTQQQAQGLANSLTKGMYGQQAQDLAARQAQSMYGLSAGGQGMQGTAGGNLASTYGAMGQLAAQLQAQAAGRGPNPALAQLAQSTRENIGAQAGLMAGQRGAGANVGLMARQIGAQGANTQQQSAGQAATLAAQQQLAAQGALAAQQTAMAGVAGQQGALGGQMTAQQMAAMQYGGQLGQQQMDNFMKATGMSADEAYKAMALEQQMYATKQDYQQKNYATQVGAQSASDAANKAMWTSIGGGLAGSLGTVLMSDEKEKTDISDGNASIEKLLDGINAKQYKYKNPGELPGTSAGTKTGVMAQDLEKSKLGAKGVSERDGVKMIGGPDTMANILAAQANLHHRLKELEGGRGYAGGGMVAPQAHSFGPDAPESYAGRFLSGGRAFSQGGLVGGRANHSGDTLKNDTVSAKLSPGEIVVPRSIVNSPNAVAESSQFIKNVLARHGAKRG